MRQKTTCQTASTSVSEQTAVFSIFGVSSHARKPSRNTELLFADDCTLLAHREEALQHIANRFSDTAKNFGLTISLKKTEVSHQPPLREANSPSHIGIDGTNLNAVEHFTYLGRVISNDATVSTDLDDRLSKASSVFGRLSKRDGRVTRSDSLQRSRYRGPSSFPPSCTVQRPGFSIGSRPGYWNRFTDAACAPSVASNGKTTCRTKKSSRQPVCQA